MNQIYAVRAKNAHNSELTELFKLAEEPDVISFAGGFPDPSWFLKEVEEIGLEILKKQKDIALQYGPVPGLTNLRELIADKMSKQNINAKVENILIISGALQGLDLMCRVFLDPGDYVVVEAPTYLGALSTIENSEARVVSIPCDEFGLKVDELEQFLKCTAKKPKFIYTIPTFQNPSGRVLTLERRKKLIQLSYDYQIPIVEDNAYGDLRYDGVEVPAIKALDKENMVIYLGTFSKIFSPGIRLGWMVAPEGLIKKFMLFKQAIDQMSSTLSQLLVYEVWNRGLIEKQIDVSRKGLKAKRNITLNALEEYFKNSATWTISEGGFYTWVQINDSNHKLNTLKALELAVKKFRVAYVAGPSFFADRSGENCLRICYSLCPEAQIKEGIKRIARVFGCN